MEELTYKEVCFLRLFKLCALRGQIQYMTLAKETDADGVNLVNRAQSLVKKGFLKNVRNGYALVSK